MEQTPLTSDATRLDGRPSECVRLRELNAELLAALGKALGHMLNAKIDLETGTRKRTTIDTLAGGIKIVDSAIKAAEASQQAGE